MKNKTKTSMEQNNSKPLAAEKIERQILFGKRGPWDEHFKALFAWGIDVENIIREKYEFKQELRTITNQPKTVLNCREIVRSTKEERENRIIEYDLSPLKSIVECGGLIVLIDTLRDIHHTYAQMIIQDYLNCSGDADSSRPEQLFYLKALADCFDEIKSEAEFFKPFKEAV